MPNGTSSLCYERSQMLGAPAARPPLVLSEERRERGGKKSRRTTARVWKENA